MRVMHISLQQLVKERSSCPVGLRSIQRSDGLESFESSQPLTAVSSPPSVIITGALEDSLGTDCDPTVRIIQGRGSSWVQGKATEEDLDHNDDAPSPQPSDRFYDVIICNPPFFTQGTKPPSSQSKAAARHADVSLPFKDLATGVSVLLRPLPLLPQGVIIKSHPGGEKLGGEKPEAVAKSTSSFFIVLPTTSCPSFIEEANQNGLVLVRISHLDSHSILSPLGSSVLVCLLLSFLSVKVIKCGLEKIPSLPLACRHQCYESRPSPLMLKKSALRCS